MSVGTRESGPGTGPLPVLPAPEPEARDTAGVFYARLTVLPALLAMPFLLTSFPLLLLGWFKPVPVILAWLVLAALLVPFGWRRIPSVAGGLGWGTARAAGGKRTPWWALGALAAVSAGFGADQAVFHSQFIIVMLDAASYMQFAFWISHHGSLPIPQHAAAFGGAPGISFDSAAFYQVGHVVVPQFMAGLPMVLSLGYWAGGVKAALLFGPLLGAAAVFTFGGLAGRLVGPRWGWVAALVIAVSLPEEFTSRSTYSELLAQILLLGGLALWIDSQRTDRGPADGGRWLRAWRAQWRNATHVLAFLAGLALGINLLIRIDAPSDILLAVPFCGVLALQRRRQVAPLVVGMVIGLAYGTADGLVLSRPYLKTNISSVVPMTAAFAFAAAVTALVVIGLLLRGRRVPRVHPRVADAATVLPFLVILAFAARPYVEKDWAALKYAPLSLHWVYWYVGGPILALAVIAAALLARRCLRGQAPAWALPLLVFAWAIPEFLYRPAIVPHNPYASRRLVPAVLPGLILLALWLSAWAVRKIRAARFDVPSALRRVLLAGVSLACAVALIVPPLQETFGLRIDRGGAQGLRLVSDGIAVKRTYTGEVAAVNDLCQAIPPDSSVLFVDYGLERELLEDVRAMCGVPTAWVVHPTSATLAADIRAIERAGRHPVVFSATHTELGPLRGGTAKRVMALYTAIDVREIASPPRTVDPVVIVVYRWEPGS
jgi:hypothetical protein